MTKEQIEQNDSASARAAPRAPKIGMVSLGCPKALVDSERILTDLRASGYVIAADYQGADAVVVNTCGFLDSAKAESLAAIGEAVAENGRVIVTGCMGRDEEAIRAAHPAVLAVTGPQAFDDVLGAVRDAAPIAADPLFDLAPPPPPTRLTPRHYAYVKISEGCNHSCRFCIIPQLRGPLASRPAAAVLREAEKLAAAGARELLIISQDTSAYGVDIAHTSSPWRGADVPADIAALVEALSTIEAEDGARVWIRLHYVYPYPHVDRLIPLMADDLILPYLDIPFQHASPRVLKAMRRPANQEKTLERLEAWRARAPELAIRSTFITGFPGETEADFEALLDWLRAARLDRVGCFTYENVAGAAANALEGHVPEPVKQERRDRLMALAQEISAEKLQAKIGRTLDVIVDEVDKDGAIGRSKGEAPEIDGSVFIDRDFEGLKPGARIAVAIDEASEYDLWGAPTGA